MILMVFSLLLLPIVRESCISECKESVSRSSKVEGCDCCDFLSRGCRELISNNCANLTIKCKSDIPNTLNTDYTTAIQQTITLTYNHYSCRKFSGNKNSMCSSTSVGPTSSCYNTHMRGTTWCQSLHTTTSSLSQELSTTTTTFFQSTTSPKHTTSSLIMSSKVTLSTTPPKHTISPSIMSSKSTTSAISVMTTYYSSSKQESLNQVFQSMSTQSSIDHTIENDKGQTMGLFVVVGGAGGTVLLLMLVGVIILQCVILCQRKKGKHSQREGDLSERRVNLYSDYPLAANPYNYPVRGLRNEEVEEAQHTGKEHTGHRSAPSAQSLCTMTKNTEEDYAVPHQHMHHNTSTSQNARCSLQKGRHQKSYPAVDSVTTPLGDDYVLPQDHINNKLPRNQGARGALDHTGNRISNPAARPVLELSEAGGEHVYFTLEPLCDLQKKSSGEETGNRELPQNVEHLP